MTRLSKEEKARIRAERAEKACMHVQNMEEQYAAAIQYSIQHTRIYSPDSFDENVHFKKRNAATEIIVSDLDSVSAAYQYGGQDGKKTAILNFADFTRVGGGFLTGLFAQEETLCSESALYSVQKAFQETYYEKNKMLKKEMSKKKEYPDLYLNRALYSEDVVFVHNNDVRTFDVISCASPNFMRGRRYHAIDPVKNDEALQDRIHFVLQVARENDVDVLLLGAFGCGVFSQDPYRVAELFRQYLTTEFASAFERVIFPVPNSNSKNHKAFQEVLDGLLYQHRTE